MTKPVNIETQEQLKGLLREGLQDLVRTDPQILLAAMADNKDALRSALEAAGFVVGAGVADTRAVLTQHREDVAEGRVISGFGARFRRVAPSRTVTDRVTGRQRRTYIFGDAEPLCEAWVRALFSADHIDSATGKSMRQLTAEVNAATVRAPASPLTGEVGTGGSNLVPTAVAAEIFEEMNERFVLRDMVEVFTSAAPLDIPREIGQVTVSRGAAAADLSEKDMAALLGGVKLSAERVGALTYIDPKLALAAAVGPVRWVISKFAIAMAKDAQRCIVAGNRAIREPGGINALPIAGGNVWDRAKTAAYTDTDNRTRRRSFRKLMFAITQPHRDSAAAVWMANNDVLNVMDSLNDTDRQPFVDRGPGQLPTFFGRPVVETTALVTNVTADALFGDMSQYAWLEAPGGLTIEQTREGGKAWESHTIGVKVVQEVDGAPVMPGAFGKLPAVVVA